MISLSNCVERTRGFVEKSKILRFLLSPTSVIFFYGIFLFLYEIKFLRNIIPSIHPFLIGWGLVSAFYTIFFKGAAKKIPAIALLIGFAIVTVVTAVINLKYGIVLNVKAVVMTLLPLALFLPALITIPKADRKRTLFKMLVGPAAVMLVFSFIAILTYVFRISKFVTIGDITTHVGIRPFIAGVEGSPTLVYGLFVDTNHAAIYTICFAALGAILFYECRRGFFKTAKADNFGKIFGILSFVVNLIYFPLTCSRGGWVSLVVAFAFSGFLFFNHKEKSKGVTKKVLLPFLKTVLCITISVAIIVALQYTMVGVSKVAFELNKMPPSAENVSSDVGTDSSSTVTDSSSTVTDSSSTVTDSSSTETSSPNIEIVDPGWYGDEIDDSFIKPADVTGSGRMQIWQEGIKLFVKNPIFGINTINHSVVALKYFETGYLIKGTAMHNSYLDLLVSFGVVGFGFLISFFVVCLVKVLKKIFNAQSHNLSTYVVLGVAIVIACSSFFLSNVFVTTCAMYFLLLLAVGYLIASVADEQ